MDAKMLLNDLMYLTSSQLRRINLLALLKESGLKKAEFAERIGKSPSYFSQLFSLDDDKRRNIGDDFARTIEKACGKPVGWLDNRHEESFDMERDPIPQKVVYAMLAARKKIASLPATLSHDETIRIYRAAINAGLEADLTSEQVEKYLDIFLPKK